jgi:transposase
MGYSKDFKVSVVKYHFKGNTIVQTADIFSIAERTVKQWKSELKRNGELQERKVQNREHLRKITPERIDEFLAKFPDGNQREMAEYFGCTVSSVTVALKKFGYTKKKNKSDIMKPMRSSARFIWIRSAE